MAHTPLSPFLMDADDAPAHPPKTSAIHATIKELTSFASVLRMSGAAIVLAAMSAFLLQGWDGGNDVHRYCLLISQTLLLAGGGFGLSYLLKENKGARVFFGLSLLSVTANLATLGALIFSVMQWGGALSHYPEFARWKAAGGGDLLLALGAGVALLTPVAVFSFLVFARRSAKELALLFLACNLLLLIPVRESWMVGAVAILGVLGPAWAARTLLKRDVTLRTPEGYFALATCFVPAMIIITRSLWLYQVDDVLRLLLAATGFMLLRGVTWNGQEKPALQTLSGLASTTLGMTIAMSLADIVFTSAQGFYLLFGAALLCLELDIAKRHPASRGVHIGLGGWGLAVSCLIPFVFTGGMLNAALFTLAGLAVAVVGKRYQRRLLLLTGAGMIAGGVFYTAARFVQLFEFANWTALAVLGATVIVAASVIERHGAVLKLKWHALMVMKR